MYSGVGVQVVRRVTLGADEHQWGRSPFNYIPDYYEKGLCFLNNSNKGAQN